MADKDLFDPYSVDEQALLLAYHLPIGRAWTKGFDVNSTLGQLVRGLCIEFYRLQVMTQKISIEIDLNRANELLTDWEKSLGIPDECFNTDVPIEDRRTQALQKLGNFGGVQKASDFVRVASVFGIDVEIYTGSVWGTFPLTFPILFFDTTKSARHTIIVRILGTGTDQSEFPLPFPIPFEISGKSLLKCLYENLAPANVNVIFIN